MLLYCGSFSETGGLLWLTENGRKRGFDIKLVPICRRGGEMEERKQMQKESAGTTQSELEQALDVLRQFVCNLALQGEKGSDYGENLWQEIRKSPGLLRELSYYHDYGSFLCEYSVEGYTLADLLVWQVDHFKLYMDRPEEMNRYKQPRLLLESLEIMVQMERNPGPFIRKMRSETGQDILNA